MQIDLGPRLDAIRGTAREVAESVTSKFAAQHDRDYFMPMETMAALNEVKLLTISAPKRLGGMEIGQEDGDAARSGAGCAARMRCA